MRRFGFLFLLAIAACGGAQQEAKAPAPETAEPARDGSPAPDLTPAASLPGGDAPKTEPVKTSAVSKTADGSDIIPPFTAGSAAAEPEKKAGGKPAKKKAKPKKKSS